MLYSVVRVSKSLLMNKPQLGLVLLELYGLSQFTELMATAAPSGSVATLLDGLPPFRKNAWVVENRVRVSPLKKRQEPSLNLRRHRYTLH